MQQNPTQANSQQHTCHGIVRVLTDCFCQPTACSGRSPCSKAKYIPTS